MRHSLVVLLLLAFAATAGQGQYLEATIPVVSMPTGILWNPYGNKVYVSNETGDCVSVISGETNAVVATIATAAYPTYLVRNPQGSKVYCACGNGNRLMVIDAGADTVLKSINVPGYPGCMAYNATQNKLYVVSEDLQRINVFDAGPDTLLGRFRPGGSSSSDPQKLVWNPASNRLFCTLRRDGADAVLVIDCWTDLVVDSLTTAEHVSRPLVNPASNLVYVPSQFLVQVMSADGDSLLAAMPTSGYAQWSMAFAPYPNKVYVGDFNEGDIAVIDGNTQTVIDTLYQTEGGVEDLLCDTIHGKLYASGGWNVQIFDAANDELLQTIAFGPSDPVLMAWNPIQSRVYISDDINDVVYVIRDTTTGITERNSISGRRLLIAATVAQRTLNVRESDNATLVDITGRAVLALRNGDNDVSRLARGAYFLLDNGRCTTRVLLVH